MKQFEITPISFACPKCKHPLGTADNALYCSECSRTFPISGGIPDLLSQSSLAPAASRIARAMDLVAPIYESRLFASVLLKLSGIGDSSHFIDSIASFHSETLKGITGSVLDVACGPATYARRVASSSRNVYGIDISMGSHVVDMGHPVPRWLVRAQARHADAFYLPSRNTPRLPFAPESFRANNR